MTHKEREMNKRTFIIALVLIVCTLIGWYIFVSFQAREARSVSEVSIDWWGSAHADAEAEAFIHWNEDDPAEIPTNCAKCHSGKAFLDYLGQDGTTAMVVDNPGTINSVITCEVCHNESADLLETAFFPSGVEIIMGHSDALCGTCHSGNGAGTRVVSASEGFADDEIIPEASFITPHYAYAAATSYGAEAQVGYQYDGKSYVGQFKHADGVETCTDCHDPHSLRMRKDYENPDANLCAACHSNVISFPDYRDVYVEGIDYDGDGTIEGLYHEIQGMQDILMMTLQTYANQTLEQPIGWTDQFPYLFKDANNDGKIDSDEAAFPNRYDIFTPRLLRAGFNYQFSVKDPAGYVHNGKYMLQLLYDAIEDLAEIVEVDMSALVRPL
jgi:predicted CXXCH cytochrome family protein